MSTETPDKKTQRQAFVQQVRKRRERREEFERDGDKSFWSVVGMMGSVGWSVALPTVAGGLFGRWLDGRVEGSGQVFMFFFLLLGLGVGCFLAWRTVKEKL